jgi:hypothetical protein
MGTLRSSSAILLVAPRRARLSDVITIGACEFGSHMTDHPEARRHIFQVLGDVLVELLHRGTTVRANPGLFRHMYVRVARQMVG